MFCENRAVHEIMSKNMVEPEKTQTIWRLRVAYWISTPTRARTHTQKYVIFTAFHGIGGFVNAAVLYVKRGGAQTSHWAVNGYLILSSFTHR